MLQAGDRIPKGTVWTAPRLQADVSELLDEGAILLFFYLFDWSST